ncbi:unnamed protein product [Lymnaea stagnalis]|uniref:Uncharacterized protein n=1 Tax=Lymnaea stagnalis TaxID=6523 RepID=A0AAV2HBJ9_LYMST
MIFTRILTTFLLFMCIYGQKITLFEYNQEDSETNCSHGLVSDVDTVVFKAEVDFSQDLHLKYVYFQIKKRRDKAFVVFMVIDVKKDCTTSTCKYVGPHIVNITFREKARKEYSKARIRAVIVTSKEKEILSDVQIFPEIRDANETKSVLLIDDVEITPYNNTFVTNATTQNIQIKYLCESHVMPCIIEVSASDLEKPLHGRGYVAYTSKQPELNITIKYAACNLNGPVELYSCIIKREKQYLIKSKSSTTQNSFSERNITITITVPLIGILCIICLL